MTAGAGRATRGDDVQHMLLIYNETYEPSSPEENGR